MNEALKVDPNNAETLQLMASFKISQQKPDEALQWLIRSYETWKGLIEKANEADIGEQTEEREGKRKIEWLWDNACQRGYPMGKWGVLHCLRLIFATDRF